MPLDEESLKAYVHGQTGDDAFIADCWGQSVAMVDGFIGAVSVPVAISDRAKLEVGSELFHRRQAPNGISQFAAPDGAPVRVARDPMTPAYPLLSRYVFGIAAPPDEVVV